jgi:hypothetical protein
MELLRTGGRWVIGVIVYRDVLVAADATLPQRAQARARRSEQRT